MVAEGVDVDGNILYGILINYYSLENATEALISTQNVIFQ
jgi:hypothetical protein